MPSFYEQARSLWQGERQGARHATSEIRVSDAERNAVSETLSRHFAEGRLDASEFDERLGSAISSRTRADLERLLIDLPQPENSLQTPRRSRWLRIVVVVLTVLLLVSIASSIAHFVGVFLIAGVAVVVVARHRRRVRLG